MPTIFQSRFMPCPSCGASCEHCEARAHLCDPERRADFRLFQVRHEVEQLDAALAAYLASPRGRFEAWYAARERRRPRDG